MAPVSNEKTAASTAAATTIKTNSNNAPPPPGSASTTTNKQSAAATAGGSNNNNNNKNDAKNTSANANVDVNTTSNPSWTDLEKTLYRLTQGLPKSELRLMLNEADECEKALRDEIAVMEHALITGGQKQAADGAGDDEESTTTTNIHTILESSYTPMDRYWTYSALVGRLRGDDFTIPSLFAIRDENHPDHVSAMEALEKYQKQQEQQQSQSATTTSTTAASAAAPAASSSSPTMTVSVKVGGGRGAAAADANNNKSMLALMDSPAYRRVETSANILACWKKIFTNRAAIVFKKAVKPEEAPGYTDRIKFPMDLSLIRKMIVTRRHITSYADLHQYIALISHNCCKYNGKESDYGMVARDFEAMADQIIRTTVFAAHAKQEQQQSTVAAASAETTATTTATAAATVSNKSAENKIPPPTTT